MLLLLGRKTHLRFDKHTAVYYTKNAMENHGVFVYENVMPIPREGK